MYSAGLADLLAAVNLAPTAAPIRYSLAMAFAHARDIPQALYHARCSVQLVAGTHAPSLRLLAALLTTFRRKEDDLSACVLLEQALSIEINLETVLAAARLAGVLGGYNDELRLLNSYANNITMLSENFVASPNTNATGRDLDGVSILSDDSHNDSIATGISIY